MTFPGTLHVEVPRNGDYYQEWRLTDIDGAAIDLTGHSLAMDARATGGDSTVVASATLTLADASDGRVTVHWHGADFDSYGNVFASATASYDLKHTFPDGIINIPVRGYLYITPEVTQ